MAFCPQCRSEYRREFTHCKACGGLELIAELPKVLELAAADLDAAESVGFTKTGSDRVVEVDGRVIDPWRVFDLETAHKVKAMLSDSGMPSALVPLDFIQFPDGRPRFEVVVKKGTRADAEALLLQHWNQGLEREGLDASDGGDVEKCPACGAHVPLNVDECGDCGLVVGTGEERAAEPADSAGG